MTRARPIRATARPVESSARPGQAHRHCTQCEATRACPFHAASSPLASAQALGAALRARRLAGLADYYEAAFAGLTTLPDLVAVRVAKIDRAELHGGEFAELLDVETFDAPTLRRLAAVALALASSAEVDDELGEVDEEDEDG